MRRLMLWSHSHPLGALLVLLLGSAVAFLRLPALRIDASSKSLMVVDDPASRYYEETLERFPTDRITVVYVRDKGLFSPGKLRALKELVGDLEGVPGVEGVDSLFSMTNFKGDEGVLKAAPLILEVPESQADTERIRKDALANPILRKNLVSGDGTCTTINLKLDPYHLRPREQVTGEGAADVLDSLNELDSLDLDSPTEGSGSLANGEPATQKPPKVTPSGTKESADKEQWREPNFEVHVAKRIEDLLVKHETGFESLFQLGAPYVWKLITETILEDQMSLVPMSVCAFLVTLVVTMRSPNGAVLPVLTAGLSLLWTFGFMGYVGIPINILTSIVPSLLIVIGSTENVHILSEYMERMREEGAKERAIRLMTDRIGTTVLFTALTTFLGFLSISANRITMLKQFGLAVSFGLLVNPIITSLVGPVFLHFFGSHHTAEERDHPVDRLLDAMAGGIVRLVHGHRSAVLVALTVPAVVMGAFSTRMVVDNDLLGYFRKDSPVRVRAQRLHDDLAGAQTFFIRITSGQPGFFKQPENLARIAEIQKRMEEMGYFDKTVSFADPVRLIHREMNGGREEEYNVPGTKELIAQYLVFLRRDDIETYVTPGFDEANILVRHNIASSYLLKKVTRELEGEIRKILHPPLQFGLTGENILINTSADSLVRGQIAGIGILLLVVFVLTGFLFVNVKAGCLSLFPNLLPVVLNFGVMALCGIPLNTGTCMVAAIAIGIATENTIHFMSRYNKEMRNLQDRNKAMEACIRSELRPCVSASMALAMGFGVLAFSHFVPVGHFGLLSALVMLYALLANFLLTPLLLFATQLTTLIDMAALRLNQDVIKAPKLFAGLKAWQTKKVVLLGRLEKKDAGEYVVREGEFGKSLFLILEGKATAFGRGGTGNEIVFASLGPGDIFGEVALVEPGPRTASVRADETIQFIEIDWDGLERVQKLYSGVASQLFLNLSRILGKRLAAADKMLTHLPEGSKP